MHNIALFINVLLPSAAIPCSIFARGNCTLDILQNCASVNVCIAVKAQVPRDLPRNQETKKNKTQRKCQNTGLQKDPLHLRPTCLFSIDVLIDPSPKEFQEFTA